MIKILKSKYSRNIFINGVSFGSSDDFIYLRESDLFTIDRINTNIKEVNQVHFSKFIGVNGLDEEVNFSNANDLEVYLESIFKEDFILPYYDFNKLNEPIINNTGALFNSNNLPFNIDESGFFEIGTSYVWSYDSTSGDIQVLVELTKHDNSIVQILEHIEEPQDSLGNGIILPTTNGSTDNTGTNQKRPETYTETIYLEKGVHNISFEFRGTQAGAEATIYNNIIWVKRLI